MRAQALTTGYDVGLGVATGLTLLALLLAVTVIRAPSSSEVQGSPRTGRSRPARLNQRDRSLRFDRRGRLAPAVDQELCRQDRRCHVRKLQLEPRTHIFPDHRLRLLAIRPVRHFADTSALRHHSRSPQRHAADPSASRGHRPREEWSGWRALTLLLPEDRLAPRSSKNSAARTVP
jgi:hypothetical protein